MALWQINRWFGGLSTGSKRGVDGAFAASQGLDFRTDPDVLQANYVMTKQSASNVTGLVKWFAQYNTTYYAYADDGKIHSNASSWTSLRTVASSTGQGLAVFRESGTDYLYYAQNAQLGRYGDLAGSPSFTDNYQTLTTDTLWHPLKQFLNLLCIGNVGTLATLSSTGTFTSAAITLPLGWKIKSLEVKGDLLFIGAWRGTAITDYEQGAIFSWDGTATTWNSVEFINESGVNALFNQSDTLYISAGTRGNLYVFSGGKFVKIKRIPNIGAGKTIEIFPGAMTGFNGIFHFGLSGASPSSASTTVAQGIYTWGQPEKNYPTVLNFDYPISTGTASGSGMNIGAVYGASPTVLLVGWKDASTYGIDQISTSTLQTSVTYESLIYDAKAPYLPKLFKEIRIVTNGSGTVAVSYKADRASSYTSLTLASGSLSTTTYLIYPFNDSTGFIRANELQIKLTLSSGVQIIEADVFYDVGQI